jgi:NAD(P)-dependent dehydrogenase (short-subunit alcohol dehydrogenase family)
MTPTASTALLTGCSSGFGRASAARFLARGWNVIATMRSPRPDLLGSSSDTNDDAGDRLLVTALDVTDSASIASAVAEGIERFGQIDVVVNNAGVGLFSALEATPDDVIRQVFETNTFGVMAVTRAVVPHLRARGSGTIVNVTSSAAIVPMPLVAVYTASKSAIEGFSESLAYELRAFGVRVKLVEPGLAPSTSFAANSGGRRDDLLPALLPAAYASYAERYLRSMREYPLTYTAAEDVAEAVYAAATDTSERLRFAAGPDSVTMAELRRSLAEQELMARVRTMFGGDPAR